MRTLAAALLIAGLATSPAWSGDAEVKAAQGTISSQLKAFSDGDNSLAYSYAAPNIQRIFPTVDAFMTMVSRAYEPVHRPKSFAFGKAEEMSATSIRQQVMVVGPDGKDYEASYTLELQPDGTFKITGVSLRASNSLST